MTETKETIDLMEMMIEHAKVQREVIPYSGCFHPMAFIFGAAGNTIMIIENWHDNVQKRKAVGLAMWKARTDKARCMCLVTDARGLKYDAFMEHYKLPKGISVEMFRREYYRILRQHGGDLGNLPANVWEDVMTVMANGPEMPFTIRMAAYKCGPKGEVVWMEQTLPEAMKKEDSEIVHKSDLLVDWWS